MKLTWEALPLQLKNPFRIAHGVSDVRHNVVARLEGAWGEAATVVYHGETQIGIMDYLARAANTLGDDPALIEDIMARLPPGSLAARAALDMALHDLWGQRLGQPLYRLFGLNPQRMPLTSFTIALDEPSAMAQRAAESGYPIIKIKLGGPNDEAVVAAIRQATSAKLRVDVNAGWTRAQAATLIPRLAQYDVELIEQPLAVSDVEGLRELRAQLRAQRIAIPLYADESIKSARDVATHANAVDGVVIKLMKTGGLREAQRAIATARAHGLRVMLGCMIESSIGVTAAAHLAPLADEVDLDGPLLIANDPVVGVHFNGAQLVLPEGAGLGVGKRE